MSALNEILQEFALSSRSHANSLGEILRAWAFPEEYGCYSSFDVRPEFVKVEATTREFRFLCGREFEPDHGYDAEEISRIQWFKHPNGIEMGWHWDGDGTLAFFIPELIEPRYSGALVNTDCKKDNCWEWDEV